MATYCMHPTSTAVHSHSLRHFLSPSHSPAACCDNLSKQTIAMIKSDGSLTGGAADWDAMRPGSRLRLEGKDTEMPETAKLIITNHQEHGLYNAPLSTGRTMLFLQYPNAAYKARIALYLYRYDTSYVRRDTQKVHTIVQ